MGGGDGDGVWGEAGRGGGVGIASRRFGQTHLFEGLPIKKM